MSGLDLDELDKELAYERSVYKTPIVAQATLRAWAPRLRAEIVKLRGIVAKQAHDANLLATGSREHAHVAALKDAMLRLGFGPDCDPEAASRCDGVEWHAFPQTWGSTALGFGGIGGQQITSATTVVVLARLGREGKGDVPVGLVYFGGGFAYEHTITRAFEAALAGRRMPAKHKRGELGK